MLFSMGGGTSERSENTEAAAFGATVSDAPRTQTIVWWWGEGGTMESGANADVWFLAWPSLCRWGNPFSSAFLGMRPNMDSIPISFRFTRVNVLRFSSFGPEISIFTLKVAFDLVCRLGPDLDRPARALYGWSPSRQTRSNSGKLKIGLNNRYTTTH